MIKTIAAAALAGAAALALTIPAFAGDDYAFTGSSSDSDAGWMTETLPLKGTYDFTFTTEGCSVEPTVDEPMLHIFVEDGESTTADFVPEWALRSPEFGYIPTDTIVTVELEPAPYTVLVTPTLGDDTCTWALFIEPVGDSATDIIPGLCTDIGIEVAIASTNTDEDSWNVEHNRWMAACAAVLEGR